MGPFFSIIIPTLNEADFLPKILHDLEKQKEQDFEIIIVDANSTDKTKEVALSFKKLPLSFLEVGRQNVAFQRNYGALHAQGKYLIFIDADSGVATAFTKKLKSEIMKKKGLVFIPFIVPDEKNPQTKMIFNIVNFIIETSQYVGKPFSSGGSMIWEKYFFHHVGGFEEKLFISEDHQIVQKAFRHGVRARFLPEIKIKFCLRRMRKEGQLALFYKVILSYTYFLLKGDIKKKIFDYQMGGLGYQKLKKTMSFDRKIKNYFQQIKDYFKRSLKDI